MSSLSCFFLSFFIQKQQQPTAARRRSTPEAVAATMMISLPLRERWWLSGTNAGNGQA
jgi:hypothetical protein